MPPITTRPTNRVSTTVVASRGVPIPTRLSTPEPIWAEAAKNRQKMQSTAYTGLIHFQPVPLVK